MGKESRPMGKSLINSLTSLTPEITNLIDATEFTSGVGTGTVFDADTKQRCSPNSIVKYMNIKFELAVQTTTSPISQDGWMEYVLIYFDEMQAAPTVDAIITAGVTTQTLGDLARNLYRGNCIWFDSIPVYKDLATAQTVKIKIPDSFCKNKRGRVLSMISLFRSKDAADTDSLCKAIYTTMFKCYV